MQLGIDETPFKCYFELLFQRGTVRHDMGEFMDNIFLVGKMRARRDMSIIGGGGPDGQCVKPPKISAEICRKSGANHSWHFAHWGRKIC